MTTCTKCSAEIAANARFCGACGEPAKQPTPAAAAPGIDLGALHTIDEGQTRQPSRVERKHLVPGEEFAGRYMIEQLIGEGGMGVVYRARDKLTGQTVALKLIRADRLAGTEAVQRLIREGVTSRDIRHPNVVAVYDVGDSNGQPYMSMEFLAGKSLRAWNRQRMQGPDASMATAANIIREILRGLEAAHKAGVVHRDLKPENVMLLTDPDDQGVQLKILDFGIARAPNSGDTGATSIGTRGYMAPEQLTAPDAAQASADLFSLSVMFYEILVGVVPQNYWQPPSGGRADVPQAIDQLIQKGLSPSPRTRQQSVGEYREGLEAAMKPQPKPVTSGTWADRPEIQDVIKKTTDLFNTGGRGSQKDVAGDKTPPAGDRSLWSWFTYCVTKRFADGKGRAHRKEFWGFNVGAFAMFVLAGALDAIEAQSASDGLESGFDMFGNYVSSASTYTPIFTPIAWLLLVVPSIALASRRMHDLGYTGWAAAILAIPGIGQVVSILMGLPRGAPGPNAYGPDPLAPEASK
jgi:serine/threonine protein kinase